jgi:hypothetical protein
VKTTAISGARTRVLKFLFIQLMGAIALQSVGAISPPARTHNSTTAPAQSSAPAGSVLLRFAPLFMGGQQKYTAAQAVTIAQQFDVIAVQSGIFSPYVSAMKAANPALKIVAYINGAFDQSTGGTTYPSTWYARDAKGNRIQSVSFGNWLMDPTPAWGSAVASKCAAARAASKYDGCFLDTLGLGPLLPNYVTGIPIDSTTKVAYTSATWIRAQSATVSNVLAANPGAIVVPNGLASGSKYFAGSGASTAPLLAASHMAMSELWLRISNNSVGTYPTAAKWKQNVDMLVNAESNGWAVMTTTKLWTSASTAQQAAWHKFTLASFLLGAGGRSAFSFSTASAAPALLATSPWDSVAIGTPTGAYTTSGGAYVRNFTLGESVVNPGTTAVTLTLGASYVNLDGVTVTSLTLPAHSGDVLIRV